MNEIPYNLKLAVFGSTYTKFAFNSMKKLRLNAMNFSLDAECLECDKELLDQYGKHISPGAVVIFSLSACAACSKMEDVVCLNPMYYYHLLEYKRIPQCLLTINNHIRYRYPLAFRLKGIKYLFRDTKEQKDVTDKFPYITDEVVRKEQMSKLVEIWLKMFKLENLKDTNIPNEIKLRVDKNTRVLLDLIQFSIDRGYKPALVILPMSGLLNSFFSEEFIDITLNKMFRAVQTKYKIPCLYYRKHKDYLLDETMYLDGGFRMSSKGSIHFIKMVLHDLNNYGYNLTNTVMSK